MVLVFFYGRIVDGNGAHKNPSTTTTANILFLFLDSGEISSSGLASLLLVLKNKINNLLEEYYKKDLFRKF